MPKAKRHTKNNKKRRYATQRLKRGGDRIQPLGPQKIDELDKSAGLNSPFEVQIKANPNDEMEKGPLEEYASNLFNFYKKKHNPANYKGGKKRTKNSKTKKRRYKKSKK